MEKARQLIQVEVVDGEIELKITANSMTVFRTIGILLEVVERNEKLSQREVVEVILKANKDFPQIDQIEEK